MIKFRLEKKITRNIHTLEFQVLDQAADVKFNLPYEFGGKLCKIMSSCYPCIYKDMNGYKLLICVRGADIHHDNLVSRIEFKDKQSLNSAHRAILLAFSELSKKWSKD